MDRDGWGEWYRINVGQGITRGGFSKELKWENLVVKPQTSVHLCIYASIHLSI
jgi:hypothetical protein